MVGQISASLAAMARTVDDYDSMAKREMIKAKQEKALMYVLTYTYPLLELTMLSSMSYLPRLC